MLCDASQHLGTNLFAIVKGKHIAGESGTAKRSGRTRLTFDFPAEPEQGRENSLCFGQGPLAHVATGMEILIAIARLSSCSRRSAITRSASASALDMAS